MNNSLHTTRIATDLSQRIINITGRAINIKGDAAVEADNIGTFFLVGLEKWKDGWEGKKIKVIGDLENSKKENKKNISYPVIQLLP